MASLLSVTQVPCSAELTADKPWRVRPGLPGRGRGGHAQTESITREGPTYPPRRVQTLPRPPAPAACSVPGCVSCRRFRGPAPALVSSRAARSGSGPVAFHFSLQSSQINRREGQPEAASPLTLTCPVASCPLWGRAVPSSLVTCPRTAGGCDLSSGVRQTRV